MKRNQKTPQINVVFIFLKSKLGIYLNNRQIKFLVLSLKVKKY